MDEQFEVKLIECLDALASGMPLDRILSHYPEDEVLLRPLLETAATLPALRIEPSRTAEAASRRKFLSQAHALSEASPRRAWRLPPRLVASLAALALVVILFGRVVTTSAAALPGDTLYPVKRTVEEVRLVLAPDKADLAKQFEQERRDEVAALLSAGRAAEIAFSGPIDSVQTDRWVIHRLTVGIDRRTQVSGVPSIGRYAHVQGWTADGSLVATSIVVDSDGAPAAPFTATPEPTQPRPSATPTRTPQPTIAPHAPSPEPRIVPSATPRLIPTRKPAPTSAPGPAAPPTPTRADDNGDDHGGQDGGENQNGDDNGDSGDHGSGDQDGNTNDGGGDHGDGGNQDNGSDGNHNDDGGDGGNVQDGSGDNQNDGGSGDDSGSGDNQNDSGGNHKEGGGNDDGSEGSKTDGRNGGHRDK
jgi:uncharacterized membrane protein YgcG